MNLNEIFENNFDCYTEVHKGKCIEEEIAMTKGTFLEVVEHIIHQANGVDASTKTALPIQNVSGSLLSDEYIDVVFPVSNEWANEDKAHAIGKRQGAKWMRDKLVSNDR